MKALCKLLLKASKEPIIKIYQKDTTNIDKIENEKYESYYTIRSE